MRRIFSATALVLTATVLCAGVARPAQTPSPNAAAAARAATKEAQQVTYALQERHHSGMNGTVTLKPVGNKTQVTVMMTSPTHTPPKLTLHSGSDCNDNRSAVASDIALAPMNSAGALAPNSQTLVNIPIGQLKEHNYVVDVRDATQRSQLAEACASMHH